MSAGTGIGRRYVTRPPTGWRPVIGEDLVPYELWFMRRVLQDAWTEATEAYWLRRAAAFDAVGTPACDEIARACRNRASLADLSVVEFQETLESIAQGAAA